MRVVGVLMVCLTAASSAQAQAPAFLPVQGSLTDPLGEPINRSVNIHFALYDQETEGIVLWEETQAVGVNQGLFSVYLGSVQAIDLDLFAVSWDLWLGIAIESDPEMPRVYLATTPFAAYGEVCGNVPEEALPAGVLLGAQSCGPGNKVTGINAAGELICEEDAFLSGQSCPAGQFMTGVDPDGTIQCAAPYTYHRCFYNGGDYVAGLNYHAFQESECIGGLPQGTCMAALRINSQCGQDEDWRALGPSDPDGPGVGWWITNPCADPEAGVDYLCFP